MKSGRIGVLLVNLGTPEATSYWPMRAYLKEFLSDPRVIETNRALWWVILNGVILTIRPKRSGHAYEKIWNRERNESPLKTITRVQAEGVAVPDWPATQADPEDATLTTGPSLRGLFCGGTLAEEALLVATDALGPVPVFLLGGVITLALGAAALLHPAVRKFE